MVPTRKASKGTGGKENPENTTVELSDQENRSGSENNHSDNEEIVTPHSSPTKKAKEAKAKEAKAKEADEVSELHEKQAKEWADKYSWLRK